MEVIDLPGDRSSSPASRLSSKKTMWMLRVKNKQTIFARNLVCLRKRPPAEKMSHSLFQLNQTKTSHLNTITCRIVLIQVHTPKTPRRIQYGRWRKVILFYIHILELSANLTAIQQFFRTANNYIYWQFYERRTTTYTCKKVCWTRSLTLISYLECLKTVTKVWKPAFLGYFSILPRTAWILGLTWWFLCQNVLKKGHRSIGLSLS